MSEQPDTGSKDRATVALVYRTVDDLAKTLDAEFRAVNTRLDAIQALPAQVAAQHEMLTMVQARVTDAEKRLDRQDLRTQSREEAERQYRRVNRPTIILSLAALMVALSAVVIPLLH